MKCVCFLGNRSPIKEAELCTRERDFVDQGKERRQEEGKKTLLSTMESWWASRAGGEWDPGVTIKCPVYSPLKCGPSKGGFVLLASYLILRTKGMEVNNSLVNTGRGPDAPGPRAASETPPRGERGCVNSPPALRLPSWGPLGPAANSDEPPCTPL